MDAEQTQIERILQVLRQEGSISIERIRQLCGRCCSPTSLIYRMRNSGFDIRTERKVETFYRLICGPETYVYTKAGKNARAKPAKNEV